MRTSYAPQLSPDQLTEFLQDTSKNFFKFRQWLVKNNNTPQVALMVGALQAINYHWNDLGSYENSQLNAFLVHIFQQIPGCLCLHEHPFLIVENLFVELKIFLTRPNFITFKISEHKRIQPSRDVLSLEPLFAGIATLNKRQNTLALERKQLPGTTLFSLPKTHTAPENKPYLNINTVVSVLPTLHQGELINLPALSCLINHIGSLADCLNGQANFNPVVNLLADASFNAAQASALLLSLGKLAAANHFSHALNLGAIHKLLKPLESQKNAPVHECCQSTLQGVAQLLTALKITPLKDLDVGAFDKLVIRLIQKNPPSSQPMADLWQSLERIHFYTDTPCEISFKLLLRALETVGQQTEADVKADKLVPYELIREIGCTVLSIGQLVETNIRYYYPRIAGTNWIKALDHLFELLAKVLQSKKMGKTALPFSVFKYLIYALNGRVLSGMSSSDANSDVVFKFIISQSNYLMDNSSFSYLQRQEHLKLARQLYLYALATHQEDKLPTQMISFLEKNRPKQPSEQSFEGAVVNELKKPIHEVTQVGMETGPVIYPLDISVTRNSIRVDTEMKGPQHLTLIQKSRDLFRDGVLSNVDATDVILPIFWRDKPTVAGVVSQILKAEAQGGHERSGELYEWIVKNFSLEPIPTPTEQKSLSMIITAPLSNVSSPEETSSSSVSAMTTTVSPALDSAPQTSIRKEQKMPVEKKPSISKPIELMQWIELATQETTEAFKSMQTFLADWEDESMLVVVLLAVLTKSLRTTASDKQMRLQKMSELLISFIKPSLLKQEQQGISSLLLAQTGKYDKLVQLMGISSPSAPPKASKKKKKKKGSQLKQQQAIQPVSTPLVVLDSDKISSLPDTPQAWVSWREQLSTEHKDEKIPAPSQDTPTPYRMIPPNSLFEEWMSTDSLLSDIPRLSFGLGMAIRMHRIFGHLLP